MVIPENGDLQLVGKSGRGSPFQGFIVADAGGQLRVAEAFELVEILPQDEGCFGSIHAE